MIFFDIATVVVLRMVFAPFNVLATASASAIGTPFRFLLISSFFLFFIQEHLRQLLDDCLIV